MQFETPIIPRDFQELDLLAASIAASALVLFLHLQPFIERGALPALVNYGQRSEAKDDLACSVKTSLSRMQKWLKRSEGGKRTEQRQTGSCDA